VAKPKVYGNSAIGARVEIELIASSRGSQASKREINSPKIAQPLFGDALV